MDFCRNDIHLSEGLIVKFLRVKFYNQVQWWMDIIIAKLRRGKSEHFILFMTISALSLDAEHWNYNDCLS